LQELVEDEPTLFDRDPGEIELERFQVGATTSGVNHEIGFDRDGLAPRTARTRNSPLAASTALTAVLVRTSVPISMNFSINQPTTSGSKCVSIRPALWSTITFAPARAAMCENSAAI
jgi:hypothetical protein